MPDIPLSFGQGSSVARQRARSSVCNVLGFERTAGPGELAPGVIPPVFVPPRVRA